jgi:hypothetical protein
MSDAGFTAKERLRFRKLLEVANSTTYSGERDAALQAATRLAATHGMSLREAAGMAEQAEQAPPPRPRAQQPRRPRGFHADFGAAGPENMGTWWQTQHHSSSNVDRDAVEAADKKRHDQAMADAVRRGLDAEERAAEERAKNREHTRKRSNKRAWRARPEFVRILLKETHMSAKEIAAAAGVTIYDVFREKLLMRKAA